VDLSRISEGTVMATKMIFLCSCGAVFSIDDSEDMEAHIDANIDHTVSEAYVHRPESEPPP